MKFLSMFEAIKLNVHVITLSETRSKVFYTQNWFKKMQNEVAYSKDLIILFLEERTDFGLNCMPFGLYMSENVSDLICYFMQSITK